MSLTVTRNRAAYSGKGGASIKLQEVTAAGVLVGSDVPHDLGGLQSTRMTDKTPVKNIIEESGDVFTIEQGEREVIITGVMLQRDKPVLDIAEEVRGKFYRLTKYNGVVNGKHQWIIFGIGRVTPQFDIELPGGTTPFEYRAVKCASAIVISAEETEELDSIIESGITIPAGKYYVVVEQSV
jgi:hypothetical protein